MFRIFVIFTILANNFIGISTENILVVAFTGSQSHKNAFEPLYLELAKRGHKLTIIHPIKSNYNSENIKEIKGKTFEELEADEKLQNQENSKKPKSSKNSEHPNFFEMRLNGVNARTPIVPFVIPMITQACESYYQMPEVKDVLRQKFALVFIASHMVKF